MAFTLTSTPRLFPILRNLVQGLHLLFSASSRQELCSSTGLPDSEVRRAVAALTMTRTRILVAGSTFSRRCVFLLPS
jgi:hypothetical protein